MGRRRKEILADHKTSTYLYFPNNYRRQKSQLHHIHVPLVTSYQAGAAIMTTDESEMPLRGVFAGFSTYITLGHSNLAPILPPNDTRDLRPAFPRRRLPMDHL